MNGLTVLGVASTCSTSTPAPGSRSPAQLAPLAGGFTIEDGRGRRHAGHRGRGRRRRGTRSRASASEHVVPRGDGAADAIRAIVPDGVDAVFDAAVIGQPILPAIRDGGKIAAVRAYSGELQRGIAVEQVRVSEYAENTGPLKRLVELVADGKVTLRVADTFPPERAGDAHSRLGGGGVRGRLLIAF